MAPADQGLHTGDFAGSKLHDRLVEELELVLADRLLHVRAQLQAAQHRSVGRGLEHREPPLPLPLGDVHGDVRLAHERLRIGGRRVAQADADARPNRVVAVGNGGWSLNRVDQVLNVPRSVRDNPGSYRSVYSSYHHYTGGK